MITFELAVPADAETMTQVQRDSFDDDSRRFLGKPSGGPPGYDRVEFTLMQMRGGDYYKIMDGGKIVGAFLVWEMGGDHYELCRIYIHPQYQRRGIGAQALHFAEATYPQARRWTLDTPSWATRNHRFYTEQGYTRVREQDGMVYYEKRLP